LSEPELGTDSSPNSLTFTTAHSALINIVIVSVRSRLRNDLNCVEWDVKPCSTNQSGHNVCKSEHV